MGTKKFWNMQISIDLTWSKAMALAVLIAAVGLDKFNIGDGNTTFMYALPFIVFLITGKQLTDMTKELKNNK